MRCGHEVLRGADPVAGLTRRARRPAPRAGARVPGQAAAPPAGLRRRRRTTRRRSARSRHAAPAPCWCSSARCSSCSASRCPRDPLELCRGGGRGRGHGRRAAAQRGAPPRGPGLALPAGASSRATWTRWRARQAFSINFSSEISDDALFGGPDVPCRARAARERLRLQHDSDDGRGGQSGQGTDRDPAPAPGRPDPQPGRDGEGRRQAGNHHLHQHRRIARPGSRARCSRATWARWRRPTRRSPRGSGRLLAIVGELSRAPVQRELPAAAGPARGHREPDLGRPAGLQHGRGASTTPTSGGFPTT